MSVNPSGPITGIVNSNCYASADGNCSIQISREHTISASLLRQVEHQRTVKVSGLRWQKPQVFDLFPINSLASRVLCDRHNNALSRLDSAISKFSQTLARFEALSKSETAIFADEEVYFSGEDIQGWMLKYIPHALGHSNLP